ncbi:MAG TPA: peptidyl-tRNA hydrolase [Euryarchaeota archaeon]|nr:peptidyl-tRNA hydrolase [Euryarchaeota archaeon]
MSDYEYKMVIVARRDLNLSPGKLAVQVSHGAVESALNAKADHSRWFSTWRRDGQKKVVVKVSSEEELLDLKEVAKREKLPYYLVADAGHTEIPQGTLTCLAIGPAPDNLVDKVTLHLSMY